MHRPTFELMHEQVRAIFRAVTGAELPSSTSSSSPPPSEEQGALHPNGELTEVVARRFSELEAIVRLQPEVSARLPPFAFAPLADLIEGESELLVELAVPGVERSDVHVEVRDGVVEIAGVRRGPATNGRGFRHAEIPRGPFRRAIRLPPDAAAGAPRVEVENGIVRVHLAKLQMGSTAKA